MPQAFTWFQASSQKCAGSMVSCFPVVDRSPYHREHTVRRGWNSERIALADSKSFSNIHTTRVFSSCWNEQGVKRGSSR